MKKTENSFAKKRAARNERRLDAEQRVANWHSLTPKQQLTYLDKHKFVAKRQRARIAKVLANSK